MIVVTGVGRSGTSVTARVLHENLEVPMGTPDSLDTESTRACPDGSYEDEEIRTLHQRAARNDETRKALRKNLLALLRKRRDTLGRPFGVKDPRILDFPHAWGAIVQGSQLVICDRAVEDVVDSWVDVTAASRDEAMSQVNDRYSAIWTLLDQYPPATKLLLDFNKYRSERWLEAKLRDGLDLGR